MSRKKSDTILRVQKKGCNSKHNYPIELIPIFEEIEKLNFVIGKIGKSRWRRKPENYSQEIKIDGFDDSTKSFCASIYGNSFQQKLFIKVDLPREKCLLESKCLEIGIGVRERQEDTYYYEELKRFYENEIINAVKDFYKK